MSTFMAIAIVLIGSLVAFAGLHLYARWTIRNIDRGRAAVGLAFDRTDGDPEESGRDRGVIS